MENTPMERESLLKNWCLYIGRWPIGGWALHGGVPEAPSLLLCWNDSIEGRGEITVLFCPEALTTEDRVVSMHSIKERSSQQELSDRFLETDISFTLEKQIVPTPRPTHKWPGLSDRRPHSWCHTASQLRSRHYNLFTNQLLAESILCAQHHTWLWW